LDNNPEDGRSRQEITREKRERAAAEGVAAMAEIAKRNAFVAKNTLRLRELRLAKEAAEREAAAAMPPAPAKKSTRKRAG
jgi:hypothetical protein